MAKNKGGMTKVEAVRQALAELGPDAKPKQLQGYVKDTFGIDMTLGHVSVTKRQILKKAAGKKPRAQRSVARKVQPTPVTQASPGIGLADIEAVKGLLERVGAVSLHKLIAVMAR
jgi:hypothetical protein